MKKIILLFAICFSTLAVFGQGNLQFNSVKYLKLEMGTSPNVKDTIITVPNGMIWKIESASCHSNGSLSLDGVPISGRVSLSGGLVPINPPPVFPIWLPSGSYTINIDNIMNSYPIHAYLSIIEFFIAP